jgi:hypothetical protein
VRLFKYRLFLISVPFPEAKIGLTLILGSSANYPENLCHTIKFHAPDADSSKRDRDSIPVNQ